MAEEKLEVSRHIDLEKARSVAQRVMRTKARAGDRALLRYMGAERMVRFVQDTAWTTTTTTTTTYSP